MLKSVYESIVSATLDYRVKPGNDREDNVLGCLVDGQGQGSATARDIERCVLAVTQGRCALLGDFV